MNATAGFGEPGPSEAEAPRRRRASFGALVRPSGTPVLVLLLLGLASLRSDAFMTERDLATILRQHSGTGIMALGTLYVILTRGIDLPVGSLAAPGAVSAAILARDWPLPVALLMVVGIGATAGRSRAPRWRSCGSRPSW